jgi:hypothetical protein
MIHIIKLANANYFLKSVQKCSVVFSCHAAKSDLRRCRRCRRAVEEDAAVFGFAGFVYGFFAADGGGDEGDHGEED